MASIEIRNGIPDVYYVVLRLLVVVIGGHVLGYIPHEVKVDKPFNKVLVIKHSHFKSPTSDPTFYLMGIFALQNLFFNKRISTFTLFRADSP